MSFVVLSAVTGRTHIDITALLRLGLFDAVLR